VPTAFVIFCNGVACGACVGVATFFLRLWRLTSDRLFVYFAGAFALLAVHWALLVVANPAAENRPYYYLLRLAGFALIILATIDKNRAPRGGVHEPAPKRTPIA
jgi:hypothetical protein